MHCPSCSRLFATSSDVAIAEVPPRPQPSVPLCDNVETQKRRRKATDATESTTTLPPSAWRWNIRTSKQEIRAPSRSAEASCTIPGSRTRMLR